jgi:hypothetical protein
MRILGSIVAPSTTLVALRDPEIMGGGASGPQFICDEPSGQGQGIDRLLFCNHQSVRATVGYPGPMAFEEQRLADQEGLAASSLSCGGRETSASSANVALQSSYPLSSQLVSCINTPCTVVRGIRLKPAGRHPGRAARMQISAGGCRKPTLGGTAGGVAVFGWVATLSKKVIRCR